MAFAGSSNIQTTMPSGGPHTPGSASIGQGASYPRGGVNIGQMTNRTTNNAYTQSDGLITGIVVARPYANNWLEHLQQGTATFLVARNSADEPTRLITMTLGDVNQLLRMRYEQFEAARPNIERVFPGFSSVSEKKMHAFKDSVDPARFMTGGSHSGMTEKLPVEDRVFGQFDEHLAWTTLSGILTSIQHYGFQTGDATNVGPKGKASAYAIGIGMHVKATCIWPEGESATALNNIGFVLARKLIDTSLGKREVYQFTPWSSKCGAHEPFARDLISTDINGHYHSGRYVPAGVIIEAPRGNLPANIAEKIAGPDAEVAFTHYAMATKAVYDMKVHVGPFRRPMRVY